MGPDARWIGNEAGVTRESEWSVIPVVGFDDLPDETESRRHRPSRRPGQGPRFVRTGSPRSRRLGGRLLWYPGQVDVSIRPGWFYHAAEDDKVKTLDHLLDIYYTSVGGNAQLLLNIPPDKRGRIHENDARRLKELGDRLRATFAVNLAEGAKFLVQSGVIQDGIPDTERARLVYNNMTRWDFEYDLDGSKIFNIAMIREDIRWGQRIESFSLEVWDGRDWKEIARGTTVGWKKFLRFPAVEATKVRVRILRARDLIWPIFPYERFRLFGLFFDPGK